MKVKKSLLGIAAASAAFVLLDTANTAHAATISMPTQGTTYVRKGNTYKLHLKVAGRVTVNTKAKYTIKNTSNWKAIPYAGKTKNSKVFYLRAGNYKLTSSKAGSVKTSYTKLSKLKKSLDTFPLGKNDLSIRKPDKVSLNQNVKGYLDMFKSYPNGNSHSYVFTIDKPQTVTLNLTTNPIYALDKGNIFSDTRVSLEPVSNYHYSLKNWKVSGRVVNKKNSWTLAKGTYEMTILGLRGRFNYNLSSEDTNEVPAQNKITKLTPTANGLKVDYTKSKGATGYEVFIANAKQRKPDYYNSNFVYGINETTKKYPSELSQVIPSNRLINGETYNIAVIPVNTKDGNNIFGEAAKVEKYTYHVSSNSANATAPKTPNIKVSYYDDYGSDEPYINIDWNTDENVDSYEVAYRVKGSNTWTTFMSKSNNGTQIDNSPHANDVNHFVKDKTYEVRVRALHGNLTSAWTDIQTITINVTPAGN